MKKKRLIKEIVQYFEKGVDAFMPHISINCIVFGYDGQHLKVLVQRMFDEDFWLIPGGYVYKDEDLDVAAGRNLKLSGLDKLFLKQFKTFGEVYRVTKNSIPIHPDVDLPQEIISWVTKRFITVGYYALVDLNRVELRPGLLSQECIWLNVAELDKLALDHAKIVVEARKVLSSDLLNYPVIANLLSDTFTIPELRRLYEAILDRPIDRGTFRRKVSKTDILQKVGKQANSVRRPADLYQLNQEQYLRSLMEETKFGF